MTTTSPLLVSPGNTQFNFSELWALKTRGFLKHIKGNTFAPRDQEITPAVRALTLTYGLPKAASKKLIVCRLSAAWIWCGSYRVESDFYCYLPEERVHMTKALRRFNIFSQRLKEHEYITLYELNHHYKQETNHKPYGHSDKGDLKGTNKKSPRHTWHTSTDPRSFIRVTSFERTIYDLIMHENYTLAHNAISDMFNNYRTQDIDKTFDHIRTKLHRSKNELSQKNYRQGIERLTCLRNSLVAPQEKENQQHQCQSS